MYLYFFFLFLEHLQEWFNYSTFSFIYTLERVDGDGGDDSVDDVACLYSSPPSSFHLLHCIRLVLAYIKEFIILTMNFAGVVEGRALPTH